MNIQKCNNNLKIRHKNDFQQMEVSHTNEFVLRRMNTSYDDLGLRIANTIYLKWIWWAFIFLNKLLTLHSMLFLK